MEKFKYKVSIIVPVYNVEKYIRDCLESLINQTISLDKIEILLIDDGSTDNSANICNEYADKYSCVKFFKKDNEGVSRTRNYGIKLAHGKYIMYLDSDDTITPETLKSVTDFFDNHYEEVDLVTYKEFIVNNNNAKLHFRHEILNMSGIYDLNSLENIYCTQTNMNICVKNLFENNVLFDLSLDCHEDQKYILDILKDKMKMGFCNKGGYFYLRQPESVTKTYFYAYYIFEPTTAFWEKIFSEYEDMVHPYIQAAFMNDLSWKTQADILKPYQYEGEEYIKAWNRILALLERIDDAIILSHPRIDNFHKYYFIGLKRTSKVNLCIGEKVEEVMILPKNGSLDKKYKSGNEREFIDFYSENNRKIIGNVSERKLMLYSNNIIIYETKKIEIVLSRFKVKDGKIKLVGFLKSPIFSFMDKPKLYMIINNNLNIKKEIHLSDSSNSYYRSKVKTNQFWGFDIEIDTEKINSFEFKIKINEILFDAYYYFMPQAIYNHSLERYVYYNNGNEYSFNNNIFYINRNVLKKELSHKKNLQKKYFKENKKLFIIRLLADLKMKKFENLWLYYDCKGVKKDNGYYQFIHDFDKKDGITRYYVVNGDFESIKSQFNKKQRKYLVKFGSYFHKFLYLKATKVITAFIEKENYFPFNEIVYSHYIDISKSKDIIYLQHGIIHAHMPWKYSLDKLLIDKEVISTYYEKQNLIDKYLFKEESLILSGMPRYDYVDKSKKPINRILFAPSWRNYLIGRENAQWITTEEKFLKSKFFSETSAFLNSENLSEILEKSGFELDFKLHPIFERYKHLYNIKSNKVHMADSLISQTDYKVFITDFSSFVFDFVYLKRPIIYFVPDYDMFKAGMNAYRELLIPFEDAFGDFVESAQEAVESVKTILNNDCKVQEKYLHKMNNFFINYDNHQSDRLYDELIKM